MTIVWIVEHALPHFALVLAILLKKLRMGYTILEGKEKHTAVLLSRFCDDSHADNSK